MVGLVAYLWTQSGNPGTAPARDTTATTATKVGTGRSGTGHSGTGHSGGAGGKRGKSAPATFTGPDGVEARWVVKENDKPGTTAWKITGTAGGITGYASKVQAQEGQRVTLYVSTAAPTYRVIAYRMGYYQGDGARQIWESATLKGSVQPSCPVTSTVFMVQCSWAPSLGFALTKAWVQGDYLLKLVGSGGQQSYVPLTVIDPSSHATYLVQNDVLTWQAWNTYGGYDLYGGGPPGTSPTYTDRARIVSFDRPYASTFGEGSADFLGEEYPLVRFMEEHGLDVTYGTDITTDADPSSLLHHKAFLSLGHDEQWSLTMRNAAIAALHHGVNLVFFGASPVLRKVRLQASPLGPDREMVNYRTATADPELRIDPAQVSQNQWSTPPADWEPSQLVGNSYLGYTIHAPLVVTDPSSWLYAGTGLEEGTPLPNVIGADMNGYDPTDVNPPDDEILAHSPATPGVGSGHYADTTYYTLTSSKGGVFSSGTNAWIPEMGCTPNTAACPATKLGELTGNLLKLFGSGPAGDKDPSVANWQQYYS